jgi:chemotaxis protein methyltransferase CheR
VNDTALLTNGETYFFRDHGQFDLLRLRLLPELIERRRDAKSLRLWSAGCSSGEEAYSLAMLVDMLLPDRNDWNILVLGSDIDEVALKKARQGHYKQWSFRMAPPSLKQRYFQHKGDEWILDKRIRSMVTFRASNLIGETFPSAELRDMDLILCRNVFIYFGATSVAAVADKLAAALKEGGYLMTAHTELIGHRVLNLQSRLFAEGVVYQRTAPLPVAPIPKPSKIAAVPAITKRAPSAPSVPPPVMPSMEDVLAMAQESANRGEYDQAWQACRQALGIAPLAPEPHFLLAQLAQLKGDFEQARILLDKTLYLDPSCVAAHLELAALCERTENLPRAQAMRRAALEIVRALPGDAVIDPYETTAAEMVQCLAQ